MSHGKLEVNYKLNSDFSTTVTTQMRNTRLDDGKWYSATFATTATSFSLDVIDQTDSSVVETLGNQVFNSPQTTFTDMIETGEIILGNTGLTKYSLGWEAGFNGCLKEVRIGGILLPFFKDDTFENNERIVDKFMVEMIDSIEHHCTGRDVCAGSQCVNGGECVDQWNSYKCTCPLGLSGEFCQENADNCQTSTSTCDNGGICVDGLGLFTCTCPHGFTGDR